VALDERTDLPQDVEEDLGAVLVSSPVLSLLGIELVSWGAGASILKLETQSTQANLVGGVHGGILFTLADAAFEVACNSWGRVCVALETTCHYSAPAYIGETLYAQAHEVSRSRRVGSYRIDVRAGKRDVAWYMALCYRTENWHLGPQRWPEQYKQNH
jgi:acyl-CoA thioesterase